VICKSCKEPYTPTVKELDSLKIHESELKGGVLYRGKGCSACMGTGYKGRMGIYELLIMNDEVKAVVLAGSDSNKINNIALATGMIPLKENGKLKVIQGLTTPDEVLRVC
jgi:general secretion pathway protein E